MILLEVRNISKSFPGVRALDKMSIAIKSSEVHALVGANGAGKSTLVNIIAGILKPDEGESFLRGKRVHIQNPAHARRLGISLVPQIPSLCENMTVMENIFLGEEKRFVHRGFLNWQQLFNECRRLLEILDIHVDPKAKVRDLSASENQLVEIARALSFESSIFILDEPTAMLTSVEKEKLFNIIKKLKAQGRGIIYISHRLEEVFEIADSYTVLRDGKVVSTGEVSSITKDELVKMITGEEVSLAGVKREAKDKDIENAEKILELKNVTADGLHDISFFVRKGEMLGITGLVGSGKSELAKVVFGLSKIRSGEVLFNGKPLTLKTPKQALKVGMGFVPADRLKRSLFPHRSVVENVSIASLQDIAKLGWLPLRGEKAKCTSMIKQLSIVTHSLSSPVMFLSGGNQQKVSVARWLMRSPKLLIFEEPTQGVDVKAKQNIWDIMENLREKGISILITSSDVDELLMVCDRILVMFDGRIVAEFKGNEVSKESIVGATMGRRIK